MRGKIFIALVAVWCVAAIAGPAHAASIADLMYLDGATLNLASDNDAQELFFDAGVIGSLDVGDVIRGVIDFNTLNSPSANVGGITGNNEASAVFSLEVTGIGPVIGIDPVTGFPLHRITFGPDATFPGFLWGLGDPVVAPFNTIVRLYEDAGPDTDFTTSLAIGYDTAGPSLFPPSVAPPGAAFWDLGFAGAAGEGWIVPSGILPFTPAAGVNPGTALGIANFALTLLANPSGYGIVPQPMDALTAGIMGVPPGTPADFIGSSTVRGAMGSTAAVGWHAESDANMTFLAVPLPAAVYPGMVMLGLLGIGSYRRWRRSDRV